MGAVEVDGQRARVLARAILVAAAVRHRDARRGVPGVAARVRRRGAGLRRACGDHARRRAVVVGPMSDRAGAALSPRARRGLAHPPHTHAHEGPRVRAAALEVRAEPVARVRVPVHVSRRLVRRRGAPRAARTRDGRIVHVAADVERVRRVERQRIVRVDPVVAARVVDRRCVDAARGRGAWTRRVDAALGRGRGHTDTHTHSSCEL